jgi:hypothetical protein
MMLLMIVLMIVMLLMVVVIVVIKSRGHVGDKVTAIVSYGCPRDATVQYYR